MTSPQDGPRTPRSPLGAAFFLLLALTVFYALFHQARDWNSATRLLLTYAVSQKATVAITDFVSRDGVLLEHPQTRDLSSPGDGTFYCDKAPGQSLLGVLPVWIGLQSGWFPAHPEAASVLSLFKTDYLATVATSGLFTAWTAALLFLLLLRLGAERTASMITALVYALGTIALPYATLYYGHPAAALFSFASLYLIVAHGGSSWATMLAGACAGYGVVIDYPQAVFPLAAGLALLLFQTPNLPAEPSGSPAVQGSSRIGRLMYFVIGGIPLALFLGWYHTRVTGSPFRVPYTLEVEEIFDYHRKGLGIPIGWPRWDVSQQLLWGSRRGLLWFAPAAFGAIPGLFALWRARQRWIAATCLLTFVGLFCINAGFPTWDGGWSTGTRFLLPGLPFLLLPAGYWFGTGRPLGTLGWIARGVWLLAGLYGLVVNLMMTVAGIRVHPGAERPITEWAIPLIDRHRTAVHGGDLLLKAIGMESKSGWAGYYLLLALALGIGLLTILVARLFARTR